MIFDQPAFDLAHATVRPQQSNVAHLLNIWRYQRFISHNILTSSWLFEMLSIQTDSRWAFRKQIYSQFHKLHTPMMPWCALCILFWKWNPKIRDMAFQCCSRSNFSARPGLDSPAPGLHKCHRLPRYIRWEKNGPPWSPASSLCRQSSDQSAVQAEATAAFHGWSWICGDDDSNWVVTCCNMLTAPILIQLCHKVQPHQTPSR